MFEDMYILKQIKSFRNLMYMVFVKENDNVTLAYFTEILILFFPFLS